MEERLRKDKSLEVCLVCETTSSSTWSEEEKIREDIKEADGLRRPHALR